MRIREAGFLSYLDSKLNPHQDLYVPTHNYTGVTFWHILTLLAIIGGGMVLSFIILCLEKINWNWYHMIKNFNSLTLSGSGYASERIKGNTVRREHY